MGTSFGAFFHEMQKRYEKQAAYEEYIYNKQKAKRHIKDEPVKYATFIEKIKWQIKNRHWKNCRQKQRAMIREIGY